MSRYIEFVTHGAHTEFSLGNPVHDGRVPSPLRQVRGLRVDGKLLHLADDTLAERLHRTLAHTAASYDRLGIAFNCVTFAAAMHGIALDGPEHNPLVTMMVTAEVSPADRTIKEPINLGLQQRGATQYRHTVTPAHTRDTALYLHKLGDDGPVCLSSLSAALRMFGCNTAHRVVL